MDELNKYAQKVFVLLYNNYELFLHRNKKTKKLVLIFEKFDCPPFLFPTFTLLV